LDGGGRGRIRNNPLQVKNKVMGGFTKILLKDTSAENIQKQNEILAEEGVDEMYRFYSENDVLLQWEGFQENPEYFPDHLFPKDKINSYTTFKEYWNTEAIGEIYCPPFGMLTFDCYFNRMDQAQMYSVAAYLLKNPEQIAAVGGSYDTFVERAGIGNMTRNRLKNFKAL
jgi:ASC-1-like (ASCH) protein